MARLLEDESLLVKTLAGAEEVKVLTEGERPRGAASVVLSEAEVFVPLAGLVDAAQEIKRLSKEKNKVEKELSRVQARLNNPDFLARAPEEVVRKEKARAEELTEKLRRIEENLARLRELET